MTNPRSWCIIRVKGYKLGERNEKSRIRTGMQGYR